MIAIAGKATDFPKMEGGESTKTMMYVYALVAESPFFRWNH